MKKEMIYNTNTKEEFSAENGYVVPSNLELKQIVKPWKCDAIIHFISGTIVGGGPAVKYWGVDQSLRNISKDNGIKYFTVAKSPVSDSLTDVSIMPDVLVAPSQSDWNYLYKFWGMQVKNIIDGATRDGYKNILIFSEGYTAFVPQGVRQTFEDMPIDVTPNIRMVIRDSSLPDLPYNQWGGRFDPNAYESLQKDDKSLETFFIANSGVPDASMAYNQPQIKPRIPKGCVVIDTSFPFPSKDIFLISDINNWYKKELEKSNDYFVNEALAKVNDGYLPISWLTNGEIFDKDADWMTNEQKESSFKALRKLVIATAQLSENINQKILLILPEEAIEDAKRNLESYKRIRNVEISTYPYRSPNLTRKTVLAFDYTIGVNGILVGRTAQTNAIYQALLMPNTKVCILTAPSFSYMNADSSDPLLKREGIEVESANSKSSDVYKMLVKTLGTTRDNLTLSKLLRYNSFDDCMSILSGLKTGRIK